MDDEDTREMPAVDDEPFVVDDEVEPGRGRAGRGRLAAIIVAAVAVVAVAIAAVGLFVVSRPKPLAQAEPTLLGQLTSADKTLTDVSGTLNDDIGCVTTGTAPDGSACTVATPDDTKPWTKTLLPTTDPSVTAAQQAIASAAVLHDWVGVFTSPSIKITSKAPSLSGLDFTKPPSTTASGTVTVPQANDLLVALQAAQKSLQDAQAGLDAALGTSQKATALDAYNQAVTALEAALSSAGNLLSSTSGQVSDDSTRQTLQTAITAAQSVHDANTGITAGDTKTATDVQAAIDAMTAATATLDGPSQAVTASNQTWQANQAAAKAAQQAKQKASSAPTIPSVTTGTQQQQTQPPAPAQTYTPQQPTLTILSRTRQDTPGIDVNGQPNVTSDGVITWRVDDPSRVGWTVQASCNGFSDPVVKGIGTYTHSVDNISMNPPSPCTDISQLTVTLLSVG